MLSLSFDTYIQLQNELCTDFETTGVIKKLTEMQYILPQLHFKNAQRITQKQGWMLP